MTLRRPTLTWPPTRWARATQEVLARKQPGNPRTQLTEIVALYLSNMAREVGEHKAS